MTLHVSDTHRSIKDLVATGLTEPQAEAIVATIGNIDYTVVATKFDIAEIKREITELRGYIDSRLAGMDKRFDGLKIWFLGGMLTQTIALVALILAVQG